MSFGTNEIEYLLTVNTERAATDLRRLEGILIRNLGYLRRLTGSEDIDKAIMQIQRLISLLRSAQRALHLFQMASGPIGWIQFITSGVGVGMMVGDMVTEIESH